MLEGTPESPNQENQSGNTPKALCLDSDPSLSSRYKSDAAGSGPWMHHAGFWKGFKVEVSGVASLKTGPEAIRTTSSKKLSPPPLSLPSPLPSTLVVPKGPAPCKLLRREYRDREGHAGPLPQTQAQSQLCHAACSKLFKTGLK